MNICEIMRKIIALNARFLCVLLPFFVILAGCDYFPAAQKKEEKCIFRVKMPDDDGKFNHAMFFLMYKMSELPDFSRLYDQDDDVEFSLNQNCRQVLETILEKM